MEIISIDRTKIYGEHNIFKEIVAIFIFILWQIQGTDKNQLRKRIDVAQERVKKNLHFTLKQRRELYFDYCSQYNLFSIFFKFIIDSPDHTFDQTMDFCYTKFREEIAKNKPSPFYMTLGYESFFRGAESTIYFYLMTKDLNQNINNNVSINLPFNTLSQRLEKDQLALKDFFVKNQDFHTLRNFLLEQKLLNKNDKVILGKGQFATILKNLKMQRIIHYQNDKDIVKTLGVYFNGSFAESTYNNSISTPKDEYHEKILRQIFDLYNINYRI